MREDRSLAQPHPVPLSSLYCKHKAFASSPMLPLLPPTPLAPYSPFLLFL